jgi:hypothetical protein
VTTPLPIDAALRARIAAEPESEVGVFVRLRRPPDTQDRRALADAGMRIGTVAGDVVSGRLRACDVLRVAALDSVVAIEMAQDVTVPPTPSGRTTQ